MAKLKNITRQELKEILSMDGTLQEMENAVQTKEWTQDEQERVLNFLSEKDQNKANELFADILKDVESRPDYSSTNEALAHWKDERRNLAEQIKDITDLQRAYEQEIAELTEHATTIKQSFDSISDQSITPEIKKEYESLLQNLDEKISGRTEQLNLITNQHAALAIMKAEARTEQNQVIAQQWKDKTESVRESLKENWKELGDRARDAKTHLMNRMELSKEASLLQMGRVEEWRHKNNLTKARKEIEKANKLDQRIKKAQDKLIKAANKAVKRDLSYQQHSARFNKGFKVENHEVRSIEDAKQILVDTKALKEYEKVICDLTALRDERNANAASHIAQVRDALEQRRENAYKLGYTIAQKQEQGDLGRSHRAANAAYEKVNAAIDATFIDPKTLDPNVEDFIRDNPEMGVLFADQFNEEKYLEDVNKQMELEAAQQEVEQKDVKQKDNSTPLVEEKYEQMKIDFGDQDGLDDQNGRDDQNGVDDQDFDGPELE